MSYPAIETDLVDATDKLSTPCRVLFKMESQQPSGSFKLRGIGHLIGSIYHSVPENAPKPEVFSSSGGNAGLAAAYASRYYSLKCTVVLPKTTKPAVAQTLQEMGADVIIHGEHWGEADSYLRENIIASRVQENSTSIYCHPFDDPLIWEGHSFIIRELEGQLLETDRNRVKGVVCSVGGGGLMSGIIQGLRNSSYLKDVPMISVEPEGAAGFQKSIEQQKLVKLDSVKTIATSLAAPYVALQTLEDYKRHSITNVVLPDSDIAAGTVFLYDTFGQIVEPACGAAISIVADHQEALGCLGDLNKDDIVIVIVCGGKGSKKEDIEYYRTLA